MVTAIQIDDNIPIPTDRQVFRNNSKYPIAELQPGDSFFMFPSAETDAAALRRLISAAVYSHRKHHAEKRFTTRLRAKDGVRGVRCWRIK